MRAVNCLTKLIKLKVNYIEITSSRIQNYTSGMVSKTNSNNLLCQSYVVFEIVKLSNITIK